MTSRTIALIVLAAAVGTFAEEGSTEEEDNLEDISLLQNAKVQGHSNRNSFYSSSDGAQKMQEQEQSAIQKGQNQGRSAADEFSGKAALAEFIAMTLFVVIGCGSAMGVANEAGWVLQVALTFGFAITSLAYAIGSYSGGQINCAVTLALVVAGHLDMMQGLANFVAQLLGAILGALILTVICPEDQDKTGGLGANSVPENGTLRALTGEVVMTFLLVFVIFETAVNPAASPNATMAALAIGFAVFLAHSVLIPIDGCSINPTRSFGPALVRKILYKKSGSFADQWVFWVGPLLGAVLAAGVSMSLMT